MSSPLPHYQWLASSEGSRYLEEAAGLRQAGVADLKIGEHLRLHLEAERAALVLTQIDLRQRAAARFPLADRMLFTRAGLEQATSAIIAGYRAERLANANTIVDLCCGIGGDLMAMAALRVPLTAVDLDPVHVFLAEHNARLVDPGARITPRLEDVRDVAIDPDATVFIDPARRTASGKRIGYQSEPPIEWSLALADRCAAVGIKTAPGIPHELVPAGWELEHIAIDNDLKEAVLWSPSIAAATHRATVIRNGIASSLVEASEAPVGIRDARPGDWLHDLNPAVTNAGLVEQLGRDIGADRIDAEIGFLVSDHEVQSPFCTSWRVLDVLPWHEKRIRQTLIAMDAGAVDIRRRGLAGDVPTITKRLRGKGSRRVLIAMTRMSTRPTAIICAVE